MKQNDDTKVEGEKKPNKEEEFISEHDVRKQSSFIDELENKVTDLDNRYKRAVADYQNLEKRMFSQRQEWVQSASKELLLRLLPVFDTLKLAQRHLKDKGLELSVNQFLQVINNEGVERIETVGKPFDPHTMEAIQTAAGEDGKVVEEIRAGFKLYEKVLRPAQVIVGEGKK